MIIVTNFVHFPSTWSAPGQKVGSAIYARTAAEFLAHQGPDTVWLVNCDPHLTLRLAFRKLLRSGGPKLVAVDLVLRRPKGFRDALPMSVKRFLLKRVDHFIHYFSDVRAYQETFGIDAARSSFVPFKANLAESHTLQPEQGSEQYILCFGRSMRDFDTFFDAVEQLPYPAAISRQDPAVLRTHGARFTRSWEQLPANLTVLDDDGGADAQVRILENAKIVVLPILKTSMVASGISSCLNAMSLGKCVIGTEGPGMSDVFQEGEVLVVPPEEPAKLAAAIRSVWEDTELRRKTADAGFRYAKAAGGEQQLYQRILDRLASLAL